MNEHLQYLTQLIAIDTTNPPGNEIQAVKYLKGILDQHKIESFIQETAPGRGNLVARLKGNGERKPLLLFSHLDVVPSEPQFWKFPPFSATIDNGYLYGRGTVDMKNFTAMTLSTLLQAHQENWPLSRDLIFCAVSDEERGSRFGMASLVKAFPDLIRAEYALGEVGGYTQYIAGKPFYPIQTAEKGVLWVKAILKGKPGHGSIPTTTNVHWELARFLNQLRQKAFPYHSTKTFTAFSQSVAKSLGKIPGLPFRVVDSPAGPFLLKRKMLLEDSRPAATLLAMITNTVNPTGLLSGSAHNVVPSTVTLNLDCRTIPGLAPEQVLEEIQKVTGFSLDYEIVSKKLGHETPINTPLFELISKKIGDHHSGAKAVPSLTTGYTDAGELQQLGIKCYGFIPIKLGPNDSFAELYHGHNERIPIKGYLWGLNLFFELIKEFCC